MMTKNDNAVMIRDDNIKLKGKEKLLFIHTHYNNIDYNSNS